MLIPGGNVLNRHLGRIGHAAATGGRLNEKAELCPARLGHSVCHPAFCGLGTKYIFRSSLAESRDLWKVILITTVAGIINAFLIGIPTTTLYQMIVVGKDGAFGVLAAANFLSRITSKPIVIIACAVLAALINRAVYRPVISRIVRRGAI